MVHGSPNIHAPTSKTKKKKKTLEFIISKQNSFKSPKRLVITQTKQNFKKKKNTKTLEPVMIIMMIRVSCHGMPWLWIVVKHGLIIMVVVPVAWRLQLTCAISVR